MAKMVLALTLLFLSIMGMAGTLGYAIATQIMK